MSSEPTCVSSPCITLVLRVPHRNIIDEPILHVQAFMGAAQRSTDKRTQIDDGNQRVDRIVDTRDACEDID